jgi:hypothetical protein
MVSSMQGWMWRKNGVCADKRFLDHLILLPHFGLLKKNDPGLFSGHCNSQEDTHRSYAMRPRH